MYRGTFAGAGTSRYIALSQASVCVVCVGISPGKVIRGMAMLPIRPATADSDVFERAAVVLVPVRATHLSFALRVEGSEPYVCALRGESDLLSSADFAVDFSALARASAADTAALEREPPRPFQPSAADVGRLVGAGAVSVVRVKVRSSQWASPIPRGFRCAVFIVTGCRWTTADGDSWQQLLVAHVGNARTGPVASLRNLLRSQRLSTGPVMHLLDDDSQAYVLYMRPAGGVCSATHDVDDDDDDDDPEGGDRPRTFAGDEGQRRLSSHSGPPQRQRRLSRGVRAAQAPVIDLITPPGPVHRQHQHAPAHAGGVVDLATSDEDDGSGAAFVQSPPRPAKPRSTSAEPSVRGARGGPQRRLRQSNPASNADVRTGRPGGLRAPMPRVNDTSVLAHRGADLFVEVEGSGGARFEFSAATVVATQSARYPEDVQWFDASAAPARAGAVQLTAARLNAPDAVIAAKATRGVSRLFLALAGRGSSVGGSSSEEGVLFVAGGNLRYWRTDEAEGHGIGSSLSRYRRRLSAKSYTKTVTVSGRAVQLLAWSDMTPSRGSTERAPTPSVQWLTALLGDRSAVSFLTRARAYELRPSRVKDRQRAERLDAAAEAALQPRRCVVAGPTVADAIEADKDAHDHLAFAVDIATGLTLLHGRVPDREDDQAAAVAAVKGCVPGGTAIILPPDVGDGERAAVPELPRAGNLRPSSVVSLTSFLAFVKGERADITADSVPYSNPFRTVGDISVQSAAAALYLYGIPDWILHMLPLEHGSIHVLQASFDWDLWHHIMRATVTPARLRDLFFAAMQQLHEWDVEYMPTWCRNAADRFEVPPRPDCGVWPSAGCVLMCVASKGGRLRTT